MTCSNWYTCLHKCMHTHETAVDPTNIAMEIRMGPLEISIEGKGEVTVALQRQCLLLQERGCGRCICTMLCNVYMKCKELGSVVRKREGGRVVWLEHRLLWRKRSASLLSRLFLLYMYSNYSTMIVMIVIALGLCIVLFYRYDMYRIFYRYDTIRYFALDMQQLAK